MLKRKVNFYIAALLITLVGSAASFTIVRVATQASVYDGAGAHPGIPTLSEVLEESS